MRFPLWGRRDREEKLEEEIRSHLQMAVRDRVERGETAEQAEVSARREFGNVGLIKELTRAAEAVRGMASYLEENPDALLKGRGKSK